MNTLKHDVSEWVPIVFAILGCFLAALAYVHGGTEAGRQGLDNIATILVSSAAGAFAGKKFMSPSSPVSPTDPNSNVSKEQ